MGNKKSLKAMMMHFGNELVHSGYIPVSLNEKESNRASFRLTESVSNLITWLEFNDGAQDHLKKLGVSSSNLIRDLQSLQDRLVLEHSFSRVARKLRVYPDDTRAILVFTIFCNSHPEARDVLYKLGWIWEV